MKENMWIMRTVPKFHKLGNKYYSWDIDKHNGGELKVFERKGGKLVRIGTADEYLNIYKK